MRLEYVSSGRSPAPFYHSLIRSNAYNCFWSDRIEPNINYNLLLVRPETLTLALTFRSLFRHFVHFSEFCAHQISNNRTRPRSSKQLAFQRKYANQTTTSFGCRTRDHARIEWPLFFGNVCDVRTKYRVCSVHISCTFWLFTRLEAR